MTDSIKAIILGIVEGLTEFIPVSSTGHLILVGDWLNFHTANSATFDIAIQLGAILAVVVYYREFFAHYFSPKEWLSPTSLKIVTAIFPALVFGFFFHGLIKTHLFNPLTVAIALVVGGIIMVIFSHTKNLENTTTESIDTITYGQAFGIGLAQCLALWPGTSRSGATIMGGLFAGLSYELAAKFSFIIAVPVMTIAVTYDLLKSASLITMTDVKLIAIGFIVSFGVAWLSISLFFNLLKRFKLAPFGYYRIVLGLLVLWLYFK